MKTYWNCTKVLLVLLLVVAHFAVSFVTIHADDSSCLADAPGCSFGLPTFEYQALLTEMIAHATPNVHPLEANQDDLLHFPTASHFAGVLITAPLAYPMGWVLRTTNPSAIPGQLPDQNDPPIQRYTTVNIFATLKANDGANWYLIGPGQWLKDSDVARLNPPAYLPDLKGRGVVVDLGQQVLVAYDGDQMVFATLVSTGLPRFYTNEGLFHIWARRLLTPMSGDMGTPDEYNLPAVPWVMYFDHSISLHGAYWHDRFGEQHSHGCVNLSVTDAHWIYNWTDGFYADTWVYVWNSSDTTIIAHQRITAQ